MSKTKYLINKEVAEQYYNMYQQVQREIDDTFAKWGYANILLETPAIRDNDTIFKSILADTNHFNEAIAEKTKLRDAYWRDYWKNYYGEDYE